MKVSVIVPVYQVEDYIEVCLNAICKQSFKDFEIIVVDDGSEDNSIEKASIILKESGVMYRIISQENAGLSAARNTGLKLAGGDYVCFVDSDDVIVSDHLEKLVKLMERENLEVAFCNFEFTTKENRFGNQEKEKGHEILDIITARKKFCDRSIKIHCCAMMLQRKFLGRVGGFNEKLKFGEDTEFIWRVLMKTDRIGHIINSNYKYLVRENSIMTRQTTDKAIFFSVEFKRTLAELCKVDGMDEQLASQVYFRAIMGLFHSYARQADFGDFKNLFCETGGKRICWECRRFPDYRVKVISGILLLNLKIGWKVLNRI